MVNRYIFNNLQYSLILQNIQLFILIFIDKNWRLLNYRENTMKSKLIIAFFMLNYYGFVLCEQSSQNKTIEIVDISKDQLRLMNKHEKEPIEKRNQLLIDSIYTPNRHLWNGYLGNENDFTGWLNNVAYKELSKFNLKTKNINLQKLSKYFFNTVDSMTEFTGHKGVGKWYIFFGPKWTNLGGFNDGTMLIDLAHESNNKLEDLTKYFPHEINHQIYKNTVEKSENAVLYRILNEGFACYVSYLYHNGKTTIADEINYKKSDYQFSRDNDEELIELLRKYYKSNDVKLSKQFASRGYKFSKEYPSAIAYYLGFRIVEEFVKRNGKDSWKLIYTMSPMEILEQSKILN